MFAQYHQASLKKASNIVLTLRKNSLNLIKNLSSEEEFYIFPHDLALGYKQSGTKSKPSIKVR